MKKYINMGLSQNPLRFFKQIFNSIDIITLFELDGIHYIVDTISLFTELRTTT